jgi:hypothetical protein
MKSQRRQQANDALGRQLGRFREGMILRQRGVRVDVKTPLFSNLPCSTSCVR